MADRDRRRGLDYPVFQFPGSAATIRARPDGRYRVLIGAADIGTGTWTALTQIAADALEVRTEDVELRIGDTALPRQSRRAARRGSPAGARRSWRRPAACARLAAEYAGVVPGEGLEVTADMPDNPDIRRFAMHAFGAQFAEVRVHEDCGEVRVPRLLGVFAAGRIINPKTACSQLLGAMTMGLSMALHEHSVLDPRVGQVANQDFATYHVAANADVGSIQVHFLPEDDPHVNPMGAKGIGELGIVGTAAAIANATHHATGIRVRDLPITLDELLR